MKKVTYFRAFSFFAASTTLFFITAMFFFISSNKIHAGDSLSSRMEQTANKAARVNITKTDFSKEVAGERAPEGWSFLLLETQWENIHPKQKVEKDKLEGKGDRTMGVKTFAQKKAKKTEYVEVDVAYLIENLYDHVYLLADGLAYSLHNLTEEVPGGLEPGEAFSIPKKGDVRKAPFVFLIPKSAQNVAFQFLDYEYGHILLPIKGDVKKAKGQGQPPEPLLSQARCESAIVAAHSLDFSDEYEEEQAPEGWQYAIVHLSGESLLGGTIKDIVQIQPEEYTWVTTEGGYLYYSVGGSLTDEGMIRFTPEIFQHQELTFLIPGDAQVIQLGIRLRNEVLTLNLTEKKPKTLPRPIAVHRDGDIMEVRLYGMHTEDGKVIVNLGIQSLASSGIEIQPDAQFLLVVDSEKIPMDEEATEALAHRPPSPFLIPPNMFLRFEIAYITDGYPDSLYFRGYRSEESLKLPVRSR